MLKQNSISTVRHTHFAIAVNFGDGLSHTSSEILVDFSGHARNENPVFVVLLTLILRLQYNTINSPEGKLLMSNSRILLPYKTCNVESRSSPVLAAYPRS